MSKYKEVFNARKLENENSGIEEIQKSIQMETQTIEKKPKKTSRLIWE